MALELSRPLNWGATSGVFVSITPPPASPPQASPPRGCAGPTKRATWPEIDRPQYREAAQIMNPPFLVCRSLARERPRQGGTQDERGARSIRYSRGDSKRESHR